MNTHATIPAPRRSKADSLRLVERLKRAILACAMLGFGGLSVVIGSHLASASSAPSSGDDATSSSQSSSSSNSAIPQWRGPHGDNSSPSFFSPQSGAPSTSTGVS